MYVDALHASDDTIRIPGQVKPLVERPKCRLCETRPPRRFCPGIGGDICAVCCGTEREVTIDCPLDCEHLIAARQHERPPAPDGEIPYPEVRVTDQFLSENRDLAMTAGQMLFAAAMTSAGATDFDLREALDALIRTYKTRDSGLVYETRPANPMAAAVQARFQQSLDEFREAAAQRSGVHSIRDKDVLGVLVFWARAERSRNNGRRRGRAFIHSLAELVPPEPRRPHSAIIEA